MEAVIRYVRQRLLCLMAEAAASIRDCFASTRLDRSRGEEVEAGSQGETVLGKGEECA